MSWLYECVSGRKLKRSHCYKPGHYCVLVFYLQISTAEFTYYPLPFLPWLQNKIVVILNISVRPVWRERGLIRWPKKYDRIRLYYMNKFCLVSGYLTPGCTESRSDLYKQSPSNRGIGMAAIPKIKLQNVGSITHAAKNWANLSTHGGRAV